MLYYNWMSIGSCNYDRLNLEWNLEPNQEIDDPCMAAQAADIFMHNFTDSHEYSQEEWRNRNRRLRTLEWFWRQVELLSMKIRHCRGTPEA